jgi:hypothetical protein
METRSEGPVLMLFKIKGGQLQESRKLSVSFSERATFLLSFSPLSLSTSQHRECHSGILMQRWKGEWIFLLPFPLSLPTISIGEANIFTWLHP